MIPIYWVLMALSAQGPLSNIIPPSIQPKDPLPSKVLATVDGVEIRASDVEPMVWQVYRKSIEQDYIDYLIVANAAKAANVSVSGDEIQAGVDTFLTDFRQKLQPGQTIQEGLQAKNFSDSRLYLRARTELLLQKLQLQSFHPADWVEVSTLVFPTPGDNPEIYKDSAAKAMDAFAKLQKGTPWMTLLNQVTTDNRIVAAKGSIGWHPLDAFPPDVRASLQTIGVGEYTKPAKTPNGIQIFRLDLKGADAAGNTLKDLQSRYLESSKTATIQKIKAQAKVVENP